MAFMPGDGCFVALILGDHPHHGCVVALMDSMLGCIAELMLRDGYLMNFVLGCVVALMD